MASVRNRVQGDGSVKDAVLFRERATRKQTSLTYASRDEAERMAAVIEANGGDLRSAEPGHVVVSTRMIFGFGVW